MRLLDHVFQSRSPAIAGPFTSGLQSCALRYVLAEDLTATATALAFADGDRLESCLDLVHVPAERIWVEWDEEPRRALLDEILERPAQPGTPGQRAGALITCDRRGRAGLIHSFWSESAGNVALSPLVTEFDLDRVLRGDAPLDDLFRGGAASVSDSAEPAIDAVLAHLRFRFDPGWAAYYASANLDADAKMRVLRENLRGMAFDVPMLLAFFLLLSAKDSLQLRAVDRARLNRPRARLGKPSLLDHIEVRAPLRYGADAVDDAGPGGDRRPSRLHPVRGHLVRRGSNVFWRCPHLRGTARYGIVRSRTVELRCASH